MKNAVAIFLVIATAALSLQAYAACNLAGEDAIVMLDVKHRSHNESGAGIVISVQDTRIFIVTAKHVVVEAGRNAAEVRVRFKGTEARFQAQFAASQFSAGIDMAVVIVEDAKLANALGQALPWHLLRSRAHGLETQFAIIVGQGGGQSWAKSIAPEPIAKRDQKSIAIESKIVQPGFSGGGVFDPSGQLIGLILSDNNGIAEAYSIQFVLAEASRLGFPIDLKEIPYSKDSVFIAPIAQAPGEWGQQIEAALRRKLQERGHQVLDCDAPKVAKIRADIDVRQPSATTDVAVIKWQFVDPVGAIFPFAPQYIEFQHWPWQDIWKAKSDTLSEKTDAAVEAAIKAFGKYLH